MWNVGLSVKIINMFFVVKFWRFRPALLKILQLTKPFLRIIIFSGNLFGKTKVINTLQNYIIRYKIAVIFTSTRKINKNSSNPSDWYVEYQGSTVLRTLLDNGSHHVLFFHLFWILPEILCIFLQFQPM